MTKPVIEPTNAREFTRLGFTTDQLLRRPAPPGTGPSLHIKVFSDTQTVTTGDNKFVFGVSEDMDETQLFNVEIYVTTVSSSGIVQVQLRNRTQGVDMLSTRVQCDQSERNSRFASTAFVVDEDFAIVEWADEIAIDVDAAGTGAKGLGVILDFVISEGFAQS